MRNQHRGPESEKRWSQDKLRAERSLVLTLTRPRIMMAAGASASASVLDAEATVLKKLLIVKTRRKETGGNSTLVKTNNQPSRHVALTE